MRKVKIRNIRKKTIVIVLDPVYYKGGASYTEPRRGSAVVPCVTIFGGSESEPLDASVASLPQVRILKRRHALRIVAAKLQAALPTGKAAEKSAPKPKGSGARRAKKGKAKK